MAVIKSKTLAISFIKIILLMPKNIDKNNPISEKMLNFKTIMIKPDRISNKPNIFIKTICFHFEFDL